MTIHAMMQDNRFSTSNLLSGDSKTHARPAESDLQSDGHHGRDALKSAGASSGWRPVFKAIRPIAWQATKSIFSIGEDGTEIPFAGNAGKTADTGGKSHDMSLMNTIGRRQRNGCTRPVRFMPTASQRLRWNER